MDRSANSTLESLRTQIKKYLTLRNLLTSGVLGVIAIPPVLNYLFPEAGLEAASVIVSGLLSLALVFLYFQQHAMLERQTDLMRREYDTYLFTTNQVHAKGNTVYTSVRNAGRGYIRAIWLKSEVVSNTGSLECEPGFSQMKTVEGGERMIPGLSDETNLASCPLYRSRYEQIRRSRPDVRRGPSVTYEGVSFLGKSVESSTSRRSGRDSVGPQQIAVAPRQPRFDRSEAAQASP